MTAKQDADMGNTSTIPTAVFFSARVITNESDPARELYHTSRFGTLRDDGRVQLSLLEAMYLLQKNRIKIFDRSGKKLSAYQLQLQSKRLEPHFLTRYAVFADIRNRGYIIKTALKFGADFRVYDRGVKPGEDHAKWIVYPVQESTTLTWQEFSAKNRVAHSTRKKLLIGIVDDEGDVTYYEIRWVRP